MLQHSNCQSFQSCLIKSQLGIDTTQLGIRDIRGMFQFIVVRSCLIKNPGWEFMSSGLGKDIQEPHYVCQVQVSLKIAVVETPILLP